MTASNFACAGAINVIGALLEQRTGQQIAANRVWRIETALKTVLRDHGLESTDQLISRLTGAPGSALADAVIDALLNKETSFFRDSGVLEMLVEAAAKMQAEQPGRRLRIWSAGCSNGQEPYSLAMLFEEMAGSRRLLTPEIVATDVSAATVARARAGRFTQFEIQRGLPIRRMVTWFDKDGDDWAIRPELARRVQFRCHNLARDPAPPGKFDMVLCRNVLFYFPQAMRSRAYATLRSGIKPGGLLLLGAGETVIGQTDAFAPCSAFRGLYRAEPDEAPPRAVGAR